MKWRYFIIINLLCMITVGYLSFELGRMVQRRADVKKYFTTMQDEERFIIETINLVICESGNRHEEVWGDNNKAYGRFQYHESTFKEFVKEAGMQDLQMDWKNSEHQYRVYKWAYFNGRLSHWTCYKPIDF